MVVLASDGYFLKIREDGGSTFIYTSHGTELSSVRSFPYAGLTLATSELSIIMD